MNNKSNQKLILAASAVLLLNFTSCKKYEEGPAFSLRTKMARLTGEWEVVKLAGESMEDAEEEMIVEFEKDGEFSYGYSYGSYSYSIKGEWEWSSKKEGVDVTIDGETMEWEITKLSNSEFWFEDEDGDEWELEKK